MPAARPAVVLVTAHWGSGEGDESEATARLLAGALARRSEVTVVHLLPAAVVGDRSPFTDSAFTVHRLPVHGTTPMRAGIVQAALAGSGAPPSQGTVAVLDQIQRLGSDAPDVPHLVDELAPSDVVLVGHHQPWDLDACASLRRSRPARLTAVPLLGDGSALSLPHVQHMLQRADRIAAVHPGERRAVLGVLPAHRTGDVVALDLALVTGRGLLHHRLFGVRELEHYAVLLRGFPPSQPRRPRAITSEMLQRALGPVAVAEVDADGWRMVDGERVLTIPVPSSRVNLWRLMEHAAVTIDVRPQGPLGREALESLLLGTPVLVPDGSAAMEHARAASGGLWYRDTRELVAAARVLLDPPIRDRLAAQGEGYASAHHGDMAGFVERAAQLVLG